MPQLILEYSKNVLERDKITDVLLQCHHLFVKELPTTIDGCKSRAYESQIFLVGDGAPKNAFVHVSLKVLSGRAPEVLTRIGEKLLELLTRFFDQSVQQFDLQITVEVSHLARDYFKFVSVFC